ncbi:MAG: hypothetical protein QXL01_00590 [Thermoplasmatales archaeon]
MSSKPNVFSVFDIKKKAALLIQENECEKRDKVFCYIEIFAINDGQVYNIPMGNGWVSPNLLYVQLKRIRPKVKVKIKIIPVEYI